MELGWIIKEQNITSEKNFVNVKIPFASYRKKKSYKYGFIKVKDPINLKNYVTKNIKDKKSDIYINGNKIKGSNNELLNVVYKKKLNLIYDQ